MWLFFVTIFIDSLEIDIFLCKTFYFVLFYLLIGFLIYFEYTLYLFN